MFKCTQYSHKDASKSTVPAKAGDQTLHEFAQIEKDIALVEEFIASFIQAHGPRAQDTAQNFELKKREELLTQRLLKLDGLTVNETTRPMRKALIDHILKVADKLEAMRMPNS